MINKIYHALFAIGMYALPLAAQAQPAPAAQSAPSAPAVQSAPAQAPSPDTPTNYAQLATLNDRIALLKAQVQVAQLKQELSAASHTPITGQAGIPGFHPSDAPPPDTAQYGPRILSISGRGTRLSALVQMPEGDQMMVVQGSTLSDGAVVESISPQSVMVSLNNHILFLPFASTALTASGVP